MSSTIAVPGKSVPEPNEQLADEYIDVADAGIGIEVRAAVNDVEVARSAGDEPQHLEGEDDDVVEIIDGDGVHDYFTVAELRGMATDRDAERDGIINLSAAITSPDTPMRGPSGELRSARVLRRDFPADITEALDLVEKLKGAVVDRAIEVAAAKAARFLVARVEMPISDDDPDEEKRKRRPKRHGVYRIDSRMTMSPADRVDGVLPSSDYPYLCFIHGTASHTQNGFGGMLGTPEWSQLIDRYGKRILALEHPTLSVSPALNALALAEQLPTKATLHLVTHSRGGLVGDLFSLAAEGTLHGGLDIARLERLRGDAAEDEIEALALLNEILKSKKIDVARFVRAGAPASGTLLASGRVDTWAKFLMNIIGLIPGMAGTPWGSILKTVVLTFLNQRSNIDVIPGLEAQQPASPFIHFLNTSQLELNDGLGAIAHDVEGKGWIGRPKVWLADRFYGEDHDLVVDTRAMYQGVPRADAPNNAFVSFHKGPDDDHFKYFAEHDSRSRITDWLLNKEPTQTPLGFVKIDRSVKKLRVPAANRALSENAPAVVVVPSLMGSTLTDGGKTVWSSVPALSRGLGAVSASKPLTVGGVVPAYGKLSAHLAGRFRVELFAYDWRQSLTKAAEQLRQTVDQFDAATPVHIVAHSTGCLVALLALGDAEFRARVRAADGRALLLSPPLGGTMTSLQHVAAHSHLTNLLRLVDPARTPVQLAQQMQGYVSLLESLPVEGDHWQAEWWADQGLGKGPTQEKLDAALKVAKASALPEDPKGISVVMGRDTLTPLTVSTGATGIGFSGSFLGDGVVSHAALADVPIPRFYAEGNSRSLLEGVGALTAYIDILTSGHTAALVDVAPTGSPEIVPLSDRPVLFPSDGDIVDAALGTAGPPPVRDSRPLLHVEVVHGDLEYCEHPVMAGQYQGSTIFGAMRSLDSVLGGLVRGRFESGAFPGALGTHVTILTKDAGGVILGMGEIADLTGPELARSVTEATVDYALRSLEAAGSAPDDGVLTLGLAPLLVGTSGFSGLEIPNAVEAILKGVIRANRVLRDRGQKARVEKVSFVELYEDLAVAAAKSVWKVKDVLSNNPDAAVVADQFMRTGTNGVPGQPDPNYRQGEWRRVVVEGITEGSPDGAAEAVGLRFTSVGNRARAERMLSSAQRSLIDAAVAEAVDRPGGDRQVQNTLYELLLPDGLKGEGQSGENMLLVVDEQTANYPWEMLSTRSSRPGDSNLTPLSTEVGFLRRLATDSYRLRPKSAAGNNALVIGDPPAGVLPSLPAARLEAAQVADTFAASRYEVERIISGDGPEEITPLEILNGLFRADYRVVHIAAHGGYNKMKPLHSGIYIGDQKFLTATEFGRMAVTPDLVFLNCCHLGQIAAGSSGRRAGAEKYFHRLAASLSRQLIEDGVRTVVAAGWAVNDEHAATFANSFYGYLLAGEKLGDAALWARQSIYDPEGTSNTWGAYQIYGDPGFTLPKVPGGPQPPDDEGHYVAEREVLNDIEWLLRKARRPDAQPARIGGEVDDLIERTRPAWRDGEVAFRIGEVLSEAGDRERAVDFYRQAIGTFDGDVSMQAVEQFANRAVRLAKDKAGVGQIAEAKKLVLEAGKKLRNLVELSPTPERLSLYGGHYKRLIQISPDSKQVDGWISAGGRQYGAAAALHKDRLGTDDHYALLNKVQFDWLAGRRSGPLSEEDLDSLRIDIEAAAVAAALADRSDSDYWTKTTLVDVAFTRALLENSLGDKTDQLVVRYTEVLATGSPTKRDSTINTVSFLAETLEAMHRRALENDEKKIAAELVNVAKQVRMVESQLLKIDDRIRAEELT